MIRKHLTLYGEGILTGLIAALAAENLPEVA